MTKRPPKIHQIELRIGTLAELFNSMDPTPFHHCDLDNDAQEYLESWAMTYPPESHFRVIVHIAQMPGEDPEPTVREAIHNYFDFKSIVTRRNLRLFTMDLKSK